LGRAQLQKHFGEFLVAKILLIVAVLTILMQESSIQIVAEAKEDWGKITLPRLCWLKSR